MSSSQSTQQQIVEAAFQLIAQHGIDKTSLSMIAAEVGISKPAIYYHFASKEILIDYLFNETFKDYNFSTYFTLEDFTAENFEDLLVERGMQMLPHEDKDYYVLRVLNEFLQHVNRKEKYYAQILHMQEDFLQGFSDLLQRGANLGVIARENTTAKAHMLVMVIDNMSNFMLMGFKLGYREIWTEAVKGVMRHSDNHGSAVG
jgi:AcrR family transcriptional regulator